MSDEKPVELEELEKEVRSGTEVIWSERGTTRGRILSAIVELRTAREQLAKARREHDALVEILESPEHIAKLFHEEYERLAPSYDYPPRPDTRVSWSVLPNRSLMIDTTGNVLEAIRKAIDAACEAEESE